MHIRIHLCNRTVWQGICEQSITKQWISIDSTNYPDDLHEVYSNCNESDFCIEVKKKCVSLFIEKSIKTAATFSTLINVLTNQTSQQLFYDELCNSFPSTDNSIISRCNEPCCKELFLVEIPVLPMYTKNWEFAIGTWSPPAAPLLICGIWNNAINYAHESPSTVLEDDSSSSNDNKFLEFEISAMDKKKRRKRGGRRQKLRNASKAAYAK